MANTIRIKRRPSSGSAGSPSAASLYNGELAFNENDNILYYAYGSGVGGISTAVPAIAGSGAYSLRGGTNATGTWPISVNGNSASVTNGVYTTGDQSVSGVKTFKQDVYFDSWVQFQGTGLGGNSLYLDYDSGGSVGFRTDIQTYNSLGYYNKNLVIENGTFGDIVSEANFGKVVLVGTSGVAVSAGAASSGTHFAAFVDHSSTSVAGYPGGVIKTRTAAQVKSDIGLGNVEDTALSSWAGSTNITTIANDAVTNAKAANMAVNTIKGRITAGTGDPEDLTAANVRTIINVADGANNYAHPTDGGAGNTITAANLRVLSAITVNTLGHVTSVSSKDLTANDIPTLNQNTTGNAGTVTSGVYTSRTITPGSGLAGSAALDLSADRTFNIGQGDGITVSDDSIAVNSTVVRTTGAQGIEGLKDFYDNASFGGGDKTTVTIGENLGPGGSGVGVFDANIPIAAQYWSADSSIIHYAYGGGTLSSPRIAVREDSGNVGIGISTPSAKLHVNGSGIFASGLNIGNQTASTIAGFDGNKNVVSLSTGTYPSLTELGYVKGVTSSIQTQIDGKVATSDSTVVRTTGAQSVGGVKTFTSKPTFNDGLLVGGINRFTTGGAGFEFSIDRGYDPGFNGDILKFDVDNDNGTGYSTTLKTYGPAQNIIIRLPSNSGVLARLEDITTTNITGTLAVNKGGTGATTLTSNNILVGNGTSAISAPYSVETTLTGGASAIPRADAVKTYVDNMIGSGIATNDAMIFKGVLDCSTNPNYPAADRGWVYKISVAGRIGGASGPVVEVNDTIICGTDGTVAGTHASVGSNWNILQTNIVDASILVTGPASATSGNFAMFDGATGKIVKDSSFSSSSFATAGHVHGNITNAGAIGSTANLPIITTTAGVLTTGSFGSTVNTFCQGNDSRLSDTRNTTQSLTVNNDGGGTASSFTFNGGTAQTISYNSIGAPSISGANATGTWGISINGNAGSVTNGVYTSGSYADPAWISSLAKSKVGLGNVENTALSTWAGSSNITTLGTIGTGTWNATTIAVNKGGTGQTSYVNGELLIGNSTGNTLTKATLTQGTAIDITNSTGIITIGHNDTSTLSGAQGSNGIASFTVDGMGHVTAVTTATYLTSGESLCSAFTNSNCTIDGGTF